MKLKHNKNRLMVVCLLAGWNIIADADILTDGTVGDIYYLFGDNMIIPESYGTRVGDNLFHSFSMFNIYSGEAVTFTGSNTLQNVIARVTGGDVSTINGILSSNIGKANFYFINPAGVTFGKNAVVDVPAAFHVSTANQINFADGSVYSATNPAGSTLTIAKPESFGFLGQTGDIVLDGAQIVAKPNQTIDLVANNITLKNDAALYAPAGEVRLVAAKGSQNVSLVRDENGFLPLPNQTPNAENAGDIVVDYSVIDTTGNGSGRAALSGNQVSFNNKSELKTNNNGGSNAKTGAGITIQANSLELNDSALTADANDTGNAANILIKAAFLNMTDASISSYSVGDGKAGDIAIQTSGAVNLNNSVIYSLNDYFGDSGFITLQAGSLQMDNALIGSYTSSGKTGDVAVSATGNITMNTSEIATGLAYYANSGNPGNVSVKAANLTMDNAWIDSVTSNGNAGQVAIETTGDIAMSNESQILSNNSYFGDANAVSIKAGSLKMDNAKISSVASDGNSGKIAIETTGAVDMKNSAILSSSDYKDAGNIDIKAASLKMNEANIQSYRSGTDSGKAGDIAINTTGALSMNNSQVVSLNDGIGDAGKISINAGSLEMNQANIHSLATIGNAKDIVMGIAGVMNMNNGSNIASLANPLNSDNDSGRGGNIFLTANSLQMNDAFIGFMSQSFLANSNFGDINIKANTIAMNRSLIGTFSGIFEKSGNISITANSLDMKDDSAVFTFANAASASNQQNGSKAGDIFMKVGFLNMDNSSIQSMGVFGDSGNIHIEAFGNINLVNGATITNVLLQDNAKGGSILIDADNITIDGQGSDVLMGVLSTSMASGESQAGNVIINAHNQLSILGGGVISTSVLSGEGTAGNININAGHILLDGLGSPGVDIIQFTDNEGHIQTRKLPSPILTGISSDNFSSTIGKAGDITINTNSLYAMNNSAISTYAGIGNGGTININANDYLYLENSKITTTTDGANGNGGDIDIKSAVLVMDSGLIQANAVGGKGGFINLNIQALIPSYNSIIIGGEKVPWQPYIPGFNVIQAASETGLQGTVNISSPQFDISGSISGLKTNRLITPDVNRDPCQNMAASSLKRKGKGGIPANETKQSFIPPVTELPTSSSSDTLTSESENTSHSQTNQPCKAATI